MLRLFAWLSQKLQAVAGLLLPAYEKARGTGGMPRWLRVVLHVLVVAAVLVGLFWINSFFWQNIKEREWLKKTWLPLLILLIYILYWLGYWLWKLLVSDDLGPYFEDIDKAWEQAKFALRKAGIILTDQPLFLLLGQPEDDEKALFEAAKMTLEVGPAPSSPDAPLHVYATRDAIYLTCAGASLLGCHARSLAGKFKLEEKGSSGGVDGENEDDDILNKTLSPGAKGKIPNKGVFADIANMAQMFHRAEKEGRQLAELPKAEKRKLRAFYRKSKPQRSPLRNPDIIRLEEDRLRFLCHLIVRDRRPYVAINSVVLLIPYAGCDSDQDATYTAEALHRDLAVTGTSLKVDCPHYALLCDMETADGFSEFLQHIPAKDRLPRLGQSCPLNPDLTGDGSAVTSKDVAARMLDGLAKWNCRSFMSRWVYLHFQIEKAEPDRARLMRSNGRLFLLGDELQERSKRLGMILARGLAPKAPLGPLLFGGCYIAGTGSNSEAEQAFVRGLLKDKLDEVQGHVYWTPATLAEEASYAFWTNLGWTIIAIVVAIVILLYLVMPTK